MLKIERIQGCTPTIEFDKALGRLLRDRPLPGPPLRWDLTLRVVPRSTEYPSQTKVGAWYDLIWSIDCVYLPDERRNHFPNGGDTLFFLGEDELKPRVGWLEIVDAGVMPSPPRLATAPRIAAERPQIIANVDALTDNQLAFLGGRDKVLAEAHAHHEWRVEQDRTAKAYDWDAQARLLLDIYTELTPPKITPEQRLRHAGARIVRARDEVEAAMHSAASLTRNLHQSYTDNGQKVPHGHKQKWATWSTVSRPTLNQWIKGEDS